MSRYSGVVTNSWAIIGAATATEVVPYSDLRKYVMLYAKAGTCYITIGPYNPDNEIAITEGNTFEPVIMPRDEIWYRGSDSTMVVVADSEGYKENRLIYDGEAVLAPGSSTRYLYSLIGE